MTTQTSKFQPKIEFRHSFVRKYASCLILYFCLEIFSFGLAIIFELPRTEKYLCVVGSRKYSDYGRACCEKLIEGLRGYSITIVSGLALGMDAIAHKAALKAGLPTIAVPGS